MDLTAFRQGVLAARAGRTLSAAGVERCVVDLTQLPDVADLPVAALVLLENVIRRAEDDEAAVRSAERVVRAVAAGAAGDEVEYMPARVLFQDFTGVPVFCDFAAMRDAMVERGGDPRKVNPKIPCTLVIDHSVAADVSGSADAEGCNRRIELERNRERFEFLKWSQESFSNVRIVPPGQGICHQINVEDISPVVATDVLWGGAGELACFDSCVGTDSHTTTAAGIGVLAWGVGGIEAEAAAVGAPISMRVPEFVGLRLTGELSQAASGMDLALTVAQLLRAEGVVGSIVEAFGPGVATLTATQRCCVANMTPEYGATSTLFPADERVLDYLLLTGRDEAEVAFAREYLQSQGVFGAAQGPQRRYARVVELDLSSVAPSLAGPSRPHDRVEVDGLKQRVAASCEAHGRVLGGDARAIACPDGSVHELGHGTIALAAITSCTTATDPAMMVAAGMVAQRLVDAGVSPKPWVKKVLAPGSRATSLVLERAGLLEPLRKLGFYTCGYGCMSCIGNSGPILDCLHEVAGELELTSVLSGNRNFEGRISPDVVQNYLCQPALVVAYSVVGSMGVDLSSEPVGTGADGAPVYLADVLPSGSEVAELLGRVLDRSVYEEGSQGLYEGDEAWKSIQVSASDTFAWDEDSTYIRRPPYFDVARPCERFELEGARALALLGDFVTTDHISPAGAIAPTSPAADYLREHGVAEADFNTYGSRRGNHEVMERGTFANIRLDNHLAGRTGGWTLDQLTGEVVPVSEAARHYRSEGVELIVLAGKMYGSGSSRDWAAKGPLLQGVRAVIAESLERIHRSNLVQMGVLPLEFLEGQSAESLGLDGTETYRIDALDLRSGLPARTVGVHATKADGACVDFDCAVRVDTPGEARFLAAGGILPYVLQSMA